MAMTHDYLDFLDERIGISPTNSEEELQAAEVISDLMGQHDVEPSIEEFDEPLVSGLGPAILAIACLVGMVLAGTGVPVLSFVGFVLAVLPAALSVARLFGHAPRLTLGPRAQSQNVVAVHRATGPLVTKGSRTIVIAAHYDTPHENFLYSSPVAPYLTLIGRLIVPCSFVVAGCAFIQILGFLPAPFRIVLWIVGITNSVNLPNVSQPRAAGRRKPAARSAERSPGRESETNAAEKVAAGSGNPRSPGRSRDPGTGPPPADRFR